MEGKDKKVKIDASFGLKHNLLQKIWSMGVAVVFYIWKIINTIVRFIKKIWKIFVTIVVLCIIISFAMWGYIAYQKYQEEERYKKAVAILVHKLNNFDKPDSVYIVSKAIISNDTITVDNSQPICTSTYYGQAITNIKKFAENGNAEAQVSLGEYYYERYECATHEGMTIRKLQMMELEKLDSVKDLDRAAYWWKESATNGEPYGMYLIGLAYKNGKGVKTDLDQAVKWIKKSAALKDPSALLELGDLYRDGVKVEYDYHWEKNPDYIYSYDYSTKSGYYRVTDYKNILSCDMDSAMYYWRLAKDAGCEEASERLEKIYN